MISYALAFSAAIVNAVGDVLNRKASREAPAHLAFRLRLFAHLLRRRAWLAAASLMLDVPSCWPQLRLAPGQLATVQLIVILELPLTLVGSALFLGGHVPTRDWAAIMAMSAGVIGLLVLLDPEPGTGEPASAVIWLAGSAANVAVIVGLYIAARAQRQPAVRSALLGIASGFGYGLTAARSPRAWRRCTQRKGSAAFCRPGRSTRAAAAGLVSTWLLQNAYHAGTLAAAQPGITLVDPVVATLWGAAAFGEHVRHGWLLLLAVIPLALLIAGVLALSRSPSWQRNEEQPRVKPEPAGSSRASLR